MDTRDIINKMIDDIIDGNNTDAKDSFEAAISNKLTDALDAKKIEIETYNSPLDALVPKNQSYDKFCESFSDYYRSDTTAIAAYLGRV